MTESCSEAQRRTEFERLTAEKGELVLERAALAIDLANLTAENERLRAVVTAIINDLAELADAEIADIHPDTVALLRTVFQQNAPRCSRCGENHSPRCE